MPAQITENLSALGPFFAVTWGLTILCALLWPQRFRNSFLLMAALLVTMVFVSGFFPADAASWFLLACFLLVMLALFLVTLLRREGFSAAHLLSLLLGLFVGAGELAAVIYVLGLSDYRVMGEGKPWILLITFTVFYFSFLVLCFVLYSIFIQIMPHRMNFNYVIIHGCGLRADGSLTRLLSNRVDKAIRIYQKCRVKPILIPSGGKGADEPVSEAQAMKDYLLEHSVDEAHIVPEDRSATTRENLVNSKAIIDAREGKKKTALVSSNYHIYRCLRLAREVGLRCTGIGADVALYYWPSALIREFIAVFVTRGFLIWAMLGYVLFIGPALYVLAVG